MNMLVVGMSYRSAPLGLLERLASADTDKALAQLLAKPNVTEVVLVSTCNRVEVYASVANFHGALADIIDVLASHADLAPQSLLERLYVHYAEASINHIFSVAAGLDSLVLGESQILGQLRAAYLAARTAGTVGSSMHELIQHALRAGKRVHSETTIDHNGATVVSEAFADVSAALLEISGSPSTAYDGFTDKRLVIVGAGAMAALAIAYLRKSGAGHVTIVNRTPEKSHRLAQSLQAEGISAHASEFANLAAEIALADVLFACTGSIEITVNSEMIGDREAGKPLVVCDLGLPRDVDPAAALLNGVRIVDLETLRQRLTITPAGHGAVRAQQIISEEIQTFFAMQRSARVTPTVTALRKRAADVVDRELVRLQTRLPELDPATRDELANTIRRVVDKLLHTPTVRVKELAASSDADYAAALRDLFQLDMLGPAAVAMPKPAYPHAKREKGEE